MVTVAHAPDEPRDPCRSWGRLHYFDPASDVTWRQSLTTGARIWNTKLHNRAALYSERIEAVESSLFEPPKANASGHSHYVNRRARLVRSGSTEGLIG